MSTRIFSRASLLIILCMASLSLFVATASTGRAAPVPAPSLHVSGNQLLDAANQPVFLHGVNYSGGEYACVQGWGIFDGPSDQAFVSALVAAHVNAVRLPMNEDCWLGINGVAVAYSGANYQNAFVTFANLLVANGITPELDLQWSAPGSQLATVNNSMPDADHSPAFWGSVAAKFAGRSDVLFDLQNEPHPACGCWSVWKNGGSDNGFQTAGFQQLTTVVRTNGYHGVISISGIDYANTLGGSTGWLANRPTDPDGNLVAAVHVYLGNTHQSVSAWDSDFGPTAAAVPLLNNELGSYRYDDAGGLQPSFAQSFWTWLQSVHGVGTMAWTWDAWGTVEALINSYPGTSLTTWGQEVSTFYASLGGTTPSPTPTPVPPSPTPVPPTPTPSPTPPPANGSLTLLQSASHFTDYSGVSSNETGVDLPGSVRAGDLLVAVVSVAGGNPYTVGSVSDDLGNTWQRAVSGVNGDETDVEIWYTNSASSGLDGAYATLVRGTGGNSVFAQSYTTLAEFSGSGVFHAGARAGSSGTGAHASGNFAANSGDLIIGGYADAGYVGVLSITDGKQKVGVTFAGVDAIQAIDSYGAATGGTASVSYADSVFSRAEVAGASFTPSGTPPPPPPPPTGTPFQNVPCTIQLNGSTLTGICSGTIVIPA